VASSAQKRVTSLDVAREAGVARATVSYVLNRTPHQSIPEGTRQRVFDAATRLGYMPSAAARTLRRGRSDLVLCFLPAWPIGSAAGSFVSELTEAFDRRGLTLVFRTEGARSRSLREIWQEISPAAVLSHRPINPDDEEAMRAAGVQAVAILFSEVATSVGHMVRPDALIGRMQAEHLIAAGHSRLGYAYPDVPSLEDFAKPRLAGVEDACRDAAVAPPEVRPVALDAGAAAAAIQAWRSSETPITAVCAYNDETAQALLAGARLLDVVVPRDLAVIGVDDIPAACLTNPPLTTIAVDHRVEAERIVEIVMTSLRNDSPAQAPDETAMLRLVERESV
jgi:DNA-binding LacI/PurR family transcriptional regulator